MGQVTGQIGEMTQEALLWANQNVAAPAVVITYLFMLAVMFLSGLFIARGSVKYWTIFSLVAVVGGIGAYGIMMLDVAEALSFGGWFHIIAMYVVMPIVVLCAAAHLMRTFKTKR